MLKAKDIMTRDVVTVSPETTVEELGRIFIEKGISGAPIVSGSGVLKGIVTENDLIRKNSRFHIPTVLRLFDAFIPLGTSRLEDEIKRMAASSVMDICNRDVETIGEEATVEEIATLMNERKIHLLPVVAGGKIVGIVGKRDLIKGIAREAAE